MANEALFGKQAKPITSLRESIRNHPCDKAMISSYREDEQEEHHLEMELRGIGSQGDSRGSGYYGSSYHGLGWYGDANLR